ncbi:MAG TPA: hypoxanthine phosphoribosyltransferase [Trueperaceae bacterium]|nr:hypoxanthine phosphoribosyltransferase [Trueperaceae bacterium]
MRKQEFFKTGDGVVQLDAASIARRVTELGREIKRDHEGQPLHLVCVLNGAFMFMADLVRAIDMPLSVDFLSVSSYGSASKSSGQVKLIKDLDLNITDKHVILVEDIVDTGLTMNYLLDYLAAHKPLSVKVAALLSKPARREVEVPVHYLGFTIDDAFVYGYGLDVDHLFRNLPFVTSQSS